MLETLATMAMLVFVMTVIQKFMLSWIWDKPKQHNPKPTDL
jgi:hypothetical protein